MKRRCWRDGLENFLVAKLFGKGLNRKKPEDFGTTKVLIMRRFLHLVFALVAFSVALASPAAAFKLANHTFTVPDGFEVELVAGPPLVERPVSADFDEQGRLYVTDSSGSNDKVQKQLEDKPHRIVRLEDTHGDGHFDKSTLFADKMMFPEGAMWFDGSLYVAAPPSIWKLTDTDGDGAADQRQEWFQGKTLTDCANDLHGPYLGPDGWIYWCKGAFATQTYQRPGKPPFVTRAAHMFRCRPDGSGVEPVMTGGMDNPVEVAFSPSGERFFTTTFLQNPQNGRRDGIIHAIYGGVYGKVHDVIDDHKRTGDLMPVLTHLGPAAACGLTRYASRVFGEDFQDNLFATLFNLHKVTRHVLEPDGATFRTRDSDFLVSDNTDFHPTDVLEDADGSLLVIDTGGWYKICCPTSQLWKPDVLGGIYRVRRKGAPKVDDPRGLKLAWTTMKPADLVKLLGDSRAAVRSRAIQALSKKGTEPLPALAEALKAPKTQQSGLDLKTSAESRRNVIWALSRIESPKARAAARAALKDKDETVCLAAIHSASVWRDAGALPRLLELLRSSSPPLQRGAAEAVGRLGDKRAVPVLLAAASMEHDRVLEHSLTYALIEIADPVGTAAGLQSANSFRKRAALIALDQMDGGDIKPELVTPLLASTDPVLQKTAAWIIGHHPQWGNALAGFFRERLSSRNLNASDRVELEHQLAQSARNDSIQDLLAGSLRDPSSSSESRLTVLHAMAQASLKEIPTVWTNELQATLASPEEPIVRATIAAIRSVPAAKTNFADFTPLLLRLAGDQARPAELRLEALAALPGAPKRVEPEVFQFLCANLSSDTPLLRRSSAATLLGNAKLNQSQLLDLTARIPQLGALELSKLLSAFERGTNELVGGKLVAALKESKALTSIPADSLKTLLAKFPTSVQAQGAELLAAINVDAPKQKQHLDDLLTGLKDGDIRRGQTIFNSQKTACASCHAIGYLGGNIGPDLTRIGQVRTERDLLEAIVYPSASFVRSYEPMVVVTKTGDIASGVVRKDSPEEVVLVTGPNAEIRITRSEIAEMRPGTVSVMPAGLDEQLSRQELADLVAFLRATRW